MVNELPEDLFGSEPVETDDDSEGSATASTPIRWLLRSYQTAVEWKAIAKQVLFAVNGDSNVARNRVANTVRSYFIEKPLEPEDVERWKDRENATEIVRFVPPKITVSNATYVDWVYIADFLLLACVSVSDELEAENQRRDTEFDNAMRSYRKRLAVEDAREAIRHDPLATDKAITESFKDRHPDISEAAVKMARTLEKTKAVEPKAREPLKAEPMPRYKPLYFPSA